MNRKEELQHKMTSGFFGFWVRNCRISYLITGVIVLMGLVAAIQIPKESSPNVDLGMVVVSTAYPGASPTDVDSLVSDKIYKEIADIDGISTIRSTSSLGFSSLIIEIKTSAEIKDVLNDVRNKVGNAVLPTDAKTPNVTSIETSGKSIFSLYLYHKDETVSHATLVERANVIKKRLEGLATVDTVSLSAMDTSGAGRSGNSQGSYDLEILIPQEKLESYGLSLAGIAQSIQSFNMDQPIGNFEIGDKNYDYRISGKYQNIYDYLSTPITLPKGGTILLSDIATIERKYGNTKSEIYADGEIRSAIALTVNKKDSASIFAASRQAKEELSHIFSESSFGEYAFQYNYDIADLIIDDYKSLFENALSTLVLVFIAMFLFIGFFDSLFATITLPLAFLSTFIILNNGGYSMNFLTNFSLILAFGIAIDTIIVIVQAASTKLRLGYDPKTAIALAIREYAVPIIAGVSTTIVVFIPMMMLPGIMGKFLAFIPVTIFGVLASGLLFALTINSALYLLMVKKRKTYSENPKAMEYASAEEKELLELEREGKQLVTAEETGIRTRIISHVVEKYRHFMNRLLAKRKYRIFAIIAPIAFFFLGNMTFAPMLGFQLFPADDNGMMSVTIKWPVGTNTDSMHRSLGDLSSIFTDIEELDRASIVTTGNTSTISIELTDKKERKAKGQRDVFAIEELLVSRLSPLVSKGLEVTWAVASNGPPSSGGAVGINLIAENSSALPELIRVSKDFEAYLQSLPDTKNVTSSSEDTPGQFIFRINKELATSKGITPAMIYGRIAQETNGITVGSIEDNGADMDVIVKNSSFQSAITPDQILDLPLTLWNTTYRIGDFVETSAQNAIVQVARKNGDINITVGTDLHEAGNTLIVTQKILEYAKEYPFPKGISYTTGGENAENAELITAMMTALILAMVVIFAILTLQFNSYSQPMMVFYSVVMAIPFVFVGLLLTGNDLSLTFGIGFIAFMGISVNHGIILIDAINSNIAAGVDRHSSVADASASRLEPMLLTTVTTVLGILPIAMQDKFWGGLWYTIVFGLTATTFITLFSLGPLFYELFIREKKPRRWTRIFPWNWNWKGMLAWIGRRKQTKRKASVTQKEENTQSENTTT